MVGQEQGSAAKITLACASPFAFRMRPLAHRDLDDVAQRRRVAEHLVQDSDAFGDADIEAGNGPRVGSSIEKTFGRRVRELERRIGVETTARPARFAHLRY